MYFVAANWLLIKNICEGVNINDQFLGLWVFVFKCRAELRSGIQLLQTVVETKILNGFKGVDG